MLLLLLLLLLMFSRASLQEMIVVQFIWQGSQVCCYYDVCPRVSISRLNTVALVKTVNALIPHGFPARQTYITS